MKMPGHGRYAHSAIPDRPTYEWPNGARLALVVAKGELVALTGQGEF